MRTPTVSQLVTLQKIQRLHDLIAQRLTDCCDDDNDNDGHH